MTRQRLAVGAALIGMLVLGYLFAGFGNARDPGSPFTDADEAAIRRIVAQYVKDNPGEIIASLNAFAEQERATAAIDARKAARSALSSLAADDAGSFIAGSSSAKPRVVVIEFFDYHCGFCKRANDLVRSLTKGDPDIKFVFREYPILREESDLASRHALAAKAQGKYLDLHFALMDASGVLTAERIREIAGKSGIDIAKLDAALAQDDHVVDALNSNYSLAKSLGVDGTPTFIVASLEGDFLEIIPGFRPDQVTAAVAKAKKTK